MPEAGSGAGLLQRSLFDDPDDMTLRAAWRDLVERRLPEAARRHPDWPVHLDHCFARILLDAVHRRPWREVVAPPAWRNTAAPRLAAAVRLGEAVLDGTADLSALNRQSLSLRGKQRRMS
ncbi:MAG: GCN5-related N-acetyltransferase [Pseudomonadota bacterium]